MKDATHVFTTLIVASVRSAFESVDLKRPPVDDVAMTWPPVDDVAAAVKKQSHVAVATRDSACIHATGPNPPTSESCESTPTPTQYSSHDINGDRKPTATQFSRGNSSDGSDSSSLANAADRFEPSTSDAPVSKELSPSRDRSGDVPIPDANPYPSLVAHRVTASAASLLNPISVARTHAQSVTSPTKG